MAARLYDTADLNYRTAEAILTHGEAMVSRETPLFIFKYGPPGSGKSTADSIIYQNFSLNSGDFIHLDIDALIESSRELRRGTVGARSKFPQEKSINFSNKNLGTLLAEVNDIRGKISNRIFHNVSVGLDWNLTEILKAILQVSIDKNYHIMFDATGSVSNHEYYKRIFNCLPIVYKIVIVYPILSQTSQKIRTFSRANRNFSKEDEEKIYGRLRLDDARVLSTPQAKDFFERTIIPMMYAGLIHEIIMVNNEDKPDVNFKATIPLEAVRVDPTRHVPLRISDTFPVGIDEKGTIQRTPQVADKFASDSERFADLLGHAYERFNTINHDAVAAAFAAKKPSGGAGGAAAAANAEPVRAGSSTKGSEANAESGAHVAASTFGGARRKYKKTRKAKRY